MKDIKQIRRANLIRLVARHGGPEVCERMNISKQRLSQIAGVNPKQEIGERFVRRLEQVFSLPANSMDNESGATQSQMERLLDFVQRHPEHRAALMDFLFERFLEPFTAELATLPASRQNDGVAIAAMEQKQEKEIIENEPRRISSNGKHPEFRLYDRRARKRNR